MDSIPKLHSLREAARQLDLPTWKLAYLVDRGDVAPPSAQVPGRRLFTDDDICRIQQQLADRAAASRQDRSLDGRRDAPTSN